MPTDMKADPGTPAPATSDPGTPDPGTADPGTAEVERRILAFVRDELVTSGTTVGREDDLLSDLLDSVAALRLGTFAAEEFDIEIRPADFVVENFRTAVALADFVLRARRR